MPKILLIQGPNMSYLGRRQPELYGRTTAAELETNIEKRGLHSILAETGVGMVAGFGVRSYVLGLEALLGHLQAKPAPARKRTARITSRKRG